ncbi:hypothetical protein ACHAPC_007164 [Botrytis cinerea]
MDLPNILEQPQPIKAKPHDINSCASKKHGTFWLYATILKFIRVQQKALHDSSGALAHFVLLAGVILGIHTLDTALKFDWRTTRIGISSKAVSENDCYIQNNQDYKSSMAVQVEITDDSQDEHIRVVPTIVSVFTSLQMQFEIFS